MNNGYGKKRKGGRRVDNPDDFVRLEIAIALEKPIRVIPVLVNGASMPGRDDLPENLKLLGNRNAFPLRPSALPSHHSSARDRGGPYLVFFFGTLLLVFRKQES